VLTIILDPTIGIISGPTTTKLESLTVLDCHLSMTDIRLFCSQIPCSWHARCYK